MKAIPREQVLAHMRAENPWWGESGSISPFFGGLHERRYLSLFYPLLTNLNVRRAIVLLGPRRVGKTVMIHHAVQRLLHDDVIPKRILYASVDKPIYNGLALRDLLDMFGEASGADYETEICYVFFDEIQYLKEWEIHLKAIVDQFPNLRCVVSGSAAAALKLRSQESGAGRFTSFLLPPLTFHEYLVLLDKDDRFYFNDENPSIPILASEQLDVLNRHFIDYINFGGYPEVALSEDIQRDPARFVKSDIIDKVLLRDLPSLYGLQDIQELNYLFTTLAYNTADEIRLEELSQGSGVAKQTISRYIQYLEAAFLIRVVHRVDRSAKRFRRANFFKVYLTNPSIRTALFAPVDADDTAMGPLVETAIFSQWFHRDTNLFYARWPGGEVDIVHLGATQRATWAIEVKWSDRYFQNPGDLKNLRRFCHAQNLPSAVVTTRTAQGEKLIQNTKFQFVPASLYCYVVGRNAVNRRKSAMDASEPPGFTKDGE